jgi:hypothetical protein
MRILAPVEMPSHSVNPAGANTRMVEPCWNQPSSWPLRMGRVAGHLIRSAVAQVQQHVQEVQADAGNEHGGHRDHRDHMAALREPGADQRALVLAEQALHAPQRDRVDVPGVALKHR